MKITDETGQHGFSTAELIVTILIMSMIALGATMTTFQVIKVSAQSDSHMTAATNVQSAGFWISRDAQMSDNVTADNLSGNDFLILEWTEIDDSDNSTTDYTVTYFFEELTDGIGKLKRNYSNSDGLSNDTLVAQHIYYEPTDLGNTSNVSYASPALSLKLVSAYNDASEVLEYLINCRPKL